MVQQSQPNPTAGANGGERLTWHSYTPAELEAGRGLADRLLRGLGTAAVALAIAATLTSLMVTLGR